jgi:hypothetical protein
MQNLIGSLLFLANATRPDIAYSVDALGAHLGTPACQQFDHEKGILCECIGSNQSGIELGGVTPNCTQIFCDSGLQQTIHAVQEVGLC